MKKDHHFISVVMPTLGRSTIKQCQEGLDKQTRPPDEVIIINDKDKKGASWARNEGIRKSHGDLIAFTDDDLVPPENWIESLVDAIDRHKADGAGGTCKETDPLLDDIRLRRILPDKEQVDNVGLVGIGGNVMYKRQILEELAKKDGYVCNESIKISEDWEVVWRLRIHGAKLVYVPVKPIHLRRLTPLAFLRFQFTRGSAIAELFKAYRHSDTDIKIHKSLLWEKSGSKKRTNWFKVLFYKVLGPFDVKSFRSFKNFILFWIGEKFQGLGFLLGILLITIKSSNIGSTHNCFL